VRQEPQPDRGRGLVEPARENEVGNRRVDDTRRVVVRDGERPSSAREDRLEDVRRLDARIVDASVAEQHQLEWPRGTIRHHDDESLAVAVQQFGADDVCDGLVVDEPRPRGRSTRSPPDLDDGDEPSRCGRTHSLQRFETREIHRREAREATCPTKDRSGEGAYALTRLTRTEDQREHFVVGEGADAEAAHPLSRAVVHWDVRKGVLLVWQLVAHGSTVGIRASVRASDDKSVEKPSCDRACGERDAFLSTARRTDDLSTDSEQPEIGPACGATMDSPAT